MPVTAFSKGAGHHAVRADPPETCKCIEQLVIGKGNRQAGKLVGVIELPDEQCVRQAVDNGYECACQGRNYELAHGLRHRQSFKDFSIYLFRHMIPSFLSLVYFIFIFIVININAALQYYFRLRFSSGRRRRRISFVRIVQKMKKWAESSIYYSYKRM